MDRSEDHTGETTASDGASENTKDVDFNNWAEEIFLGESRAKKTVQRFPPLLDTSINILLLFSLTRHYQSKMVIIIDNLNFTTIHGPWSNQVNKTNIG